MSELVKLSPQGERVLRDALAAIEMDIEHWNQADWVRIGDGCGTTACLAGWIVATQDYQSNLNALHRPSIAKRALELLGFPGGSLDASRFNNFVFHVLSAHEVIGDEVIGDDNVIPLAGTIETLKLLKEQIMIVTGLEL